MNTSGSELIVPPFGRSAASPCHHAVCIGKANCTNCHNGPLFTNNDFHNTGIPVTRDLPADTGRALGAQQVLGDEFNCPGHYSDAQP